MPTGPEHYRGAEEALDSARRASDRKREQDADFWLREALVHATLASAAAQALSTYGVMPLAEYQAWAQACGEPDEAATAIGGEN